MHEQDHPPRLHERHAGAGVSPLPPHRARRPAFPGQTYKKQEESVALLLGILPLVADQRGGFFFSAGLDRRPAAPDVGPGAKSPVVRTLRVVKALTGLGAQRPVAPPARRGSPFLPRNGEKEGRGQAPWTPSFMARLLPLARFGVCATLSRSWGYFAAHLRTLIWGLSFIKCFFSIFFPENAFQIGLRIPEEIAPRTAQG